MIPAALNAATKAYEVTQAFEMCYTLDHVDEFVNVYSKMCATPRIAIDNLSFGLRYFEATDRANELFKRWKAERGHE